MTLYLNLGSTFKSLKLPLFVAAEGEKQESYAVTRGENL